MDSKIVFHDITDKQLMSWSNPTRSVNINCFPCCALMLGLIDEHIYDMLIAHLATRASGLTRIDIVDILREPESQIEIKTIQSLDDALPNLEINQGFILLYVRSDGSGHAVIIAKNSGGHIHIIDPQQQTIRFGDIEQIKNIFTTEEHAVEFNIITKKKYSDSSSKKKKRTIGGKKSIRRRQYSKKNTCNYTVFHEKV